MATKGFTGTQKQYLEGLASGLRLSRKKAQAASGGSPQGVAASADPERGRSSAQDRLLLTAQRLTSEENAKRRQPPEDLWGRMQQLAEERRFPAGDELFLYKFHGLFYASPVEDAFMCRLRFAGGVIKAYQLRGVADLAERYARPMLQLTSRSNLQLRGIDAGSTLDVLMGLADLGIITRGAGADGVRNVRANPTAGFDRLELIDASRLARHAHHRLLSKRGLQALPRKLTLAFDGGGAVSALPETCDVAFRAVRVPEGVGAPAGVYFRLLLGGASGHARYARDAGVLVAPERCLDVLEQVLQIYIEHGDRTNRRRARLAYLLESWGLPRFMAELSTRLTGVWAGAETGVSALPVLPLTLCELPAPAEPGAHIGFHPTKLSGTSYVGVVVPSGQLSLAQARGLARIAEDYAEGELRLTPQQNLLIPGLRDVQVPEVEMALSALSLSWRASAFRSGLVACTGSTGCQFAAGDVKRRGEELVRHLESQFQFEQPLSIHISGCHHACAQHTIADIGLLATRGDSDALEPERYQLWLGGQVAPKARFGRELASDVPAANVPHLVEDVLVVYFERRRSAESFREFVGRVALADLERWAAEQHERRSGASA
jgi:ferredoxin-nitrite reductase